MQKFLKYVIMFSLLLSAAAAWAGPVAQQIPYTMTTTLTVPGTYTFRFSLWNTATGGTTPINRAWWENKDIAMTTKTLTTTLGSVTDPAKRSGILENLDFSVQYWVKVEKLGADGKTWNAVGTRTKLKVVPYALWSAQGGDVTSVTAGKGLTSSGVTGDVMLNVDTAAGSGITVGADGVSITTGGVKSAMLAANAITSSQIAIGAVTDAKITGPISASKISATGLNADNLDGLDSTAYMKKSGDTMTGPLALSIAAGPTFPKALQITGSYGALGLGRSIVFGDSADYIRLRDVVEAYGQVGFSIDTAGNQSRLYIKHGGNVGIGTTTPDAKLHLKGAGFPNSFIYLDTTAAAQDSGLRFYENGTVKGHLFWNAASATLKFYHNVGYSGIDIASNGNVGIGTDSPKGKLDVNGTIYQRGTILHADYVFDRDYNLESIEEHSNFMWENKHLKAIPKAEVDKDGQEIVEFGAHQKGIVEELEKAHIYIEQLNAKNNELDAKNRGLEDRITKLEALLNNKVQ